MPLSEHNSLYVPEILLAKVNDLLHDKCLELILSEKNYDFIISLKQDNHWEDMIAVSLPAGLIMETIAPKILDGFTGVTLQNSSTINGLASKI